MLALTTPIHWIADNAFSISCSHDGYHCFKAEGGSILRVTIFCCLVRAALHDFDFARSFVRYSTRASQ